MDSSEVLKLSTSLQDDPERLRWLKRAAEVPISVAELALKTGILPGSGSSSDIIEIIELVPVLERKCMEKLQASRPIIVLLSKFLMKMLVDTCGPQVDPLSRYHQQDFAVYH